MTRRQFIYTMFIMVLMIPFGIAKMIMRVIAPRFDFDTFTFPVIQKVMPPILMSDIVSVQPMSLPSGTVFYMDFKCKGPINNHEKT